MEKTTLSMLPVLYSNLPDSLSKPSADTCDKSRRFSPVAFRVCHKCMACRHMPSVYVPSCLTHCKSDGSDVNLKVFRHTSQTPVNGINYSFSVSWVSSCRFHRRWELQVSSLSHLLYESFLLKLLCNEELSGSWKKEWKVLKRPTPNHFLYHIKFCG